MHHICYMPKSNAPIIKLNFTSVSNNCIIFCVKCVLYDALILMEAKLSESFSSIIMVHLNALTGKSKTPNLYSIFFP